jgi:hypothetical protein
MRGWRLFTAICWIGLVNGQAVGIIKGEGRVGCARPAKRPGHVPAGRMTRIGVIRNPKSNRNRNRPEVNAAEFGDTDLLFAEPRSERELAETLTDFAWREVGLVVVDGGDGTVREVLTALPLAFGADLPSISILSSGKTNLIARDVGTAGYGRRALDRVVQSARRRELESKIEKRPVLEIDWLDGPRPALRGTFFGAAAFVLGTEFAEKLHRRGLLDGPAVAATIALAVFQALRKEAGERWRAGQDISVALSGAEQEGSRFLFLATTLRRLMLGLWPFWGGNSEPIRYVDAPANRVPLLSFAIPLLTGRPTLRMLASGFRSGTADEVKLTFSGPFILDGEMFHSGEKGIRLTAGPTFHFVSP